LRDWSYAAGQVRLAQGAEMGRFLLGSTVVLLFGPGLLRFAAGWVPGRPTRQGEAMAQFA
jgi:phosphatidylserine decarboxylase